MIYVDDTDLLHMAESLMVCNDELTEQVQGATTDYTMLGQATGGCLKPEK